MKVETVSEETFVPLTLTITVETEEELTCLRVAAVALWCSSATKAVRPYLAGDYRDKVNQSVARRIGTILRDKIMEEGRKRGM